MAKENFVDRVTQKRKKRVDSKAKGKTFERKIAKLLSEWFYSFSGIPNGFLRAPLSGASWGGANRAKLSGTSKNLQQPGDILTPEGCAVVIECKHYKEAPKLNHAIMGDALQWHQWWEQVGGDAVNCDREPMMVVKYNDCTDALVFFNPSYVKQCGVHMIFTKLGKFAVIPLKNLLANHFVLKNLLFEPEYQLKYRKEL